MLENNLFDQAHILRLENSIVVLYLCALTILPSHGTNHPQLPTLYISSRLLTNFLCLPDGLICLSRIDQAGKGCLICLSRIDQAEKAA